MDNAFIVWYSQTVRKWTKILLTIIQENIFLREELDEIGNRRRVIICCIFQSVVKFHGVILILKLRTYVDADQVRWQYPVLKIAFRSKNNRKSSPKIRHLPYCSGMVSPISHFIKCPTQPRWLYKEIVKSLFHKTETWFYYIVA